MKLALGPADLARRLRVRSAFLSLYLFAFLPYCPFAFGHLTSGAPVSDTPSPPSLPGLVTSRLSSIPLGAPATQPIPGPALLSAMGPSLACCDLVLRRHFLVHLCPVIIHLCQSALFSGRAMTQ